MHEKQLDFNAPLLSVRRLSTTSSNLDKLSSNSNTKSKTKSRQQWEPEQEDTKPASIPFIWEQIPGKAKQSRKPNSNQPKQPPNSPKFPSIETLSMSFSSNYSEESNNDLESSGSFSSDLQTRDYLMNRFLPAAKSMIVETPQYITKKQESPVLEPPKYVKKVYSGELRPLLLEKYPINSGYNYENNNNNKEIEVVEDVKKKRSKKGFGFFLPRICTKRSSCLLNPMPGVKMKIHESRSPIKESPGPIPRLSRRTSYSGPLTPSLEKQAMDAVIKKRAESRSKEMHETRKSTPLTRSGDSLPSSPHRLSRSGRISPYRNESPRSPFHDGARFLGIPKDVHNRTPQPKTCPSLNVKSHFSPRLIPDNNSPSIVPEKTLYIDWIEKSTDPKPIGVGVESEGDFGGSIRVPPLPKSPSESWLWRKMAMRSLFSKKMERDTVEKSCESGPKWEMIVKTGNVRHDRVRYSEEMLNVSKYTEISF